jgi:hypothetical protein
VLSLWFLWDGAYSWWYVRETAPVVLAVLGLLGTLAILLLAFAIRHKPPLIKNLQHGALLFYSMIVALAVFEVGLRLLSPHQPKLRNPGETITPFDLQVFPGASPIVRFTVNEVGFRGPAWPMNDPQIYKIVTVGGSTTENDYLDDDVDWSHQIMEQWQGNPTLWVSNSGVAGHTAAHHLVLLRAFAPLFKKIDMAIFLIGVNDLNAALAYGGASTQDALQRVADDFRSHVTGFYDDHSWPLYRRLRSYQLIRTAMSRIAPLIGFLPNGQVWVAKTESDLRDLYASLPVVPLPDMELSLSEYRSRVEALGAECRTLGIRCMFMTQPSLWREDLDPETRRLLCCSMLGHRASPAGFRNRAKPYGRPHLKDSASIMARYNATLMDTCSSRNLTCLDQIPKTAEMFFDDFHFTEAGSRRVASVIVRYLSEYLQSEPATLRGPEAVAHPLPTKQQ